MTSNIVVVDPQRTGTGHWPVPEERRTVTVLFADIVGSTGLVERLDPEDVRALQRAYFDTVAGVLHRWQGVVEKYVGDAVMALFGARHSDGFDAYRAVRAGLEIQAALDRRPMVGDIRLRVRVGVATGEVVVDLGGAVSGGHGVASGAVITTAARLQEYAKPGAVALCAATARATAGLITQRQLAAVPVTGRVPPMPVWHAVGPVRPGTDRHDGPLIGRRRELATIRDQVSQAIREQSPKWLSLVGPTGSGRSRLLHELTRGLTTVDGMSVRWCVATCQPYPDQVLAPAAELLRGLAGVRHGDGPAVVHDRLVSTLTSLFSPERVATAIPALQRFLTTPDSSSAALAGAAVCRDVLLRLAANQPLIVAVDDVDRAAPAMSRFLHALFSAATARGLPLALITLHQPQWADSRPSPARRLTIGPLATVQSGRLLRHLLSRAGQPVTLAGRLLPLVGGRPGHAAAYVASLVEGADPEALPLPEALRRVAGAELDHLDGERRAVLMAAGTLGGVVSGAAVDRALDWTPGRSAPALRGLVAAGLLLLHRAGGYVFAAPALRQVAAERLPRALRAVFSRRVADGVCIDTVHPEAVLPNSPAAERPAAVRAGAVRAGAVVGGSGAQTAEVVPLDAARSRAGLRALPSALAQAPQSGLTGSPRRRMPTPTMAPPPTAINGPGGPRRLRAVASAGDVRASPSRANTGHHWPSDVGHSPAAIRAVPAVPRSAGQGAPAGVDAPPGAMRAVPRPPLIRRPDALAASA
ncbi:adenylate/guanylate cyclase domain-containing protein [Micromonospora sp. WMMD961]|uniref:adenylate/guanylate cyclase domain-containing protein n=1 Tax=Micromonospora sp. WMMD961 TaxID=3016100 RepID=UPI002416E5C1|nr:adenylate/guanylate cyclase domain-containing protein [Micromonospora sp. WMMD961]MDG4781624.1 adenylate/guanylate cyclase domain-containing protein [Micromonospora sp. WMMD961]